MWLELNSKKRDNCQRCRPSTYSDAYCVVILNLSDIQPFLKAKMGISKNCTMNINSISKFHKKILK